MRQENSEHYQLLQSLFFRGIKLKIYIAGKITGCKFYKLNFLIAEIIIRLKGHSVMNPAWIKASKEFNWNHYMIISRSMQSVCDATFFMSNFTKSKGAMEEYSFAINNSQKSFFSYKDIK